VIPFRWIVDAVRHTFVGDVAASQVAWGVGWSLVLFVLALWWGTATFRRENA
jgi:ABC-2 type transport system permease protein